MNNSIQILIMNAPLLAQGLFMTIKLLLGASCISFTVGTLLGTLSSQRLNLSVARACIAIYVFITRGIPVYVQVLIGYFVIPDLLGISLSPFIAAICALGICSSGYVTEIVRGGINSIALGQWDAAYTLGYSQIQTIRYIILPQMLANALPSLSNEIEALLKSTAILSVIGLAELTKMASNIVARYMIPVPVYITIAGLYLVLSALLKIITRAIEQRLHIT